MVVIKRRANNLPTQGYGVSLPYGDGVSPRSSSASSQGWAPGRRFSFEFGAPDKQSHRWLIRFLCILVVVSGIAAYKVSNNARDLADNLEGQQMALKIQGDETFATLKDAREGLKSMRDYVEGLKRTQDALYHEIRMVNEMFEAESSSEMPASPMRGSSDGLVESWMQHRQDALKLKIKNLKEFIQQESRVQVIEK